MIVHILSELNGWDQELIALNFKQPLPPFKPDEWKENEKETLERKRDKVHRLQLRVVIIILALKQITVYITNSGLLFPVSFYSLAFKIQNSIRTCITYD